MLGGVNPLSNAVDGLRGMRIGSPARLGQDFDVLVGAVVVGVAAASSLVERPAR